VLALLLFEPPTGAAKSEDRKSKRSGSKKKK
jgi:hypothetical protein